VKTISSTQNAASIIGKRCATFDEIHSQSQVIAENYRPEKIILFGSYAYGNPTPESDVDLLIIADSEIPAWKLSAEISLKLDHAFPIDIIVKSTREIEDRLANGDFFIQNILTSGKVLYERPC
jgi:predicted nucleotidyltransferase